MAFDLPARPTQGCMACKAQQPYAVEHFTNRNTGGRCLVLCLSAGKYRFNLHLMEYGMRVALPRSIYDLSGLRPSQEYAAATFD